MLQAEKEGSALTRKRYGGVLWTLGDGGPVQNLENHNNKVKFISWFSF